eukprot:12880036-Alexandrium_andersonii.AAC.1
MRTSSWRRASPETSRPARPPLATRTGSSRTTTSGTRAPSGTTTPRGSRRAPMGAPTGALA